MRQLLYFYIYNQPLQTRQYAVRNGTILEADKGMFHYLILIDEIVDVIELRIKEAGKGIKKAFRRSHIEPLRNIAETARQVRSKVSFAFCYV